MFMHNKRLQYTVRVAEPNPALESLLLEQFVVQIVNWQRPFGISRKAGPKTTRAGRTCCSTSRRKC